MSGTLEHPDAAKDAPKPTSLSDSLSDFFAPAEKMLSPIAQKAEQGISDLAAEAHLPGLEIVGADKATVAPDAKKPDVAGDTAAGTSAAAVSAPGAAAHPGLLTEIGNVAKQFGTGALNEIENHPLQLAETAAIGFASGVVIGGAVAVAVGAGILAAPEVAIGGLAIAGITLAVGAGEAYVHRDAIIHNTEVVANPDAYSASDVAQARQSVQNFGGAALETGVGVASGIAGGIAGNALAAGISDALAPAAAKVASPLGETTPPSDGSTVANASGATAATSDGATAVTSDTAAATATDGSTVAAGAGDVKTVSASLADGRSATVTLQGAADGGTQVSEVKMADGTVLSRQGATNHWVTDGGGPGKTVWDGDVRLNDNDQLSFVYKYEKAPSVVSVEARLPDGSKVALAGPDGSLSLPSSTVDTISQRLPEAGSQSVKPLYLIISPDRLQLDSVSTGSAVNTKYVVNLNDDEAASVRQLAATDAGVKIVPADTPVGQVAAAAHATGPMGENVPGAYEYSQPMPDHTASVALFSKADDGSWNVLTGLREREPFAGKVALPGGFLDMPGGSIEAPADAATRELAEETGVKTANPALVRIGDSLGRDARNRIIDFQYSAVASPEDMAKINPSDDLYGVKPLSVKELLADPNSLAFDHYQMLSAAYQHLLATQPK